MGRWLQQSVDLIDEIRKKTIDADDFSAGEWCEDDAGILELAANMIRRELRIMNARIPQERKKR
jgi:hypothetical protein